MIRPLAKAPDGSDAQNLRSDPGLSPGDLYPLKPASFLTRAERVYCDHAAMIDGRARRTWPHAATRCRCLAGALSTRDMAIPSP